MVLAELGQKISGALNDLNKKAVVGDDEVKACLQEVSRALLQADVHVTIVKKLRDKVTQEIKLQEGGGLDMRKLIARRRGPGGGQNRVPEIIDRHLCTKSRETQWASHIIETSLVMAGGEGRPTIAEGQPTTAGG